MCKVLESIEINKKYKNLILCEPQLGKRDLYPSVSKDIYKDLFIQSNLLAYSMVGLYWKYQKLLVFQF